MSKNKNKNSNTSLIVLLTFFICSLCCIGVFLVGLINSNPIAPSQSVTIPTTIPLETVIVQTVSGAQTQTAFASSPTPIPTQTLASTIPIEVTSTVFIFELQTNIAQPTLEYIFYTSTPFILTIPSPNSSSGSRGVCSCTGDILNCTEHFSSQVDAQACFDYCISIGTGDIHKLDGNNDGVACESLP